MKIEADNSSIGSHRTGTLNNITVDEINQILGFTPNVDDDPYKVVNSWQFRAGDHICAIWDYKGSHEYGSFSAFGDASTLRNIFGDRYS